MFRTAASSYGRAGAQYRSVDSATRVEGASPHRLVAILFEELSLSIARTRAAVERGDAAKRSEQHSRALAILQALETSIDFGRGGSVAAQLSAIYREATRLLLTGVRQGDIAAFDAAQTMLGEIASAWSAIA